MTDVTHDLDTLRAEYTPKQRENFENHLKPVLARLDVLAERAEERDAVDAFDVSAARKWFLRTYRPKKRGDGLMERDHVQIGEPEHLFKKELGKLGNPWGSIQGLVMASFGISDETQEEITDAAVTLFVARNLGNEQKLAKVLDEHQKVGELYGVSQ